VIKGVIMTTMITIMEEVEMATAMTVTEATMMEVAIPQTQVDSAIMG
jgi:hypothetical protein